MEIQKGDRVLVNIAPFIGSLTPGSESVPCEVLEVDGCQVCVRPEPPYRDVCLWVLSSWIEGRQGKHSTLLSAAGANE